MRTFIEFQVVLLKSASDYLSELEKSQDRDALANALHNSMWNLKGPRQVDSDLTPRDEYFSMIFKGFKEITASFTQLRDIEIYIRRFPYRNTSISRSRHLEYHIGNYLQEIYILRNRLINYLTRIRRAFRKSPQASDANKICGTLNTLVETTFKSITLSRGDHVHRRRYFDDDLDRVQTWELFAAHPKDDNEARMLRFMDDRNYKELRGEWVKRIKTNNENTEKMFDVFFGTLYPLLFKNDGNLHFPF
jgi:hypothetical protein